MEEKVVGRSGASRRSRVLLVALASGASIWCLAFLAPPLSLHYGVFPEAGFLSRAFFGMTCHQDPTRSLHIHGMPLAVCARCSAVYAGFTVAVAAWAVSATLRRLSVNHGLVALAVAIPVLDWLLGLLFAMPSTNVSRFVTGAIGGGALGALVADAVSGSSILSATHHT